MLEANAVIQMLLVFNGAMGNLTAACEGLEQARARRSKASGPLQDAMQLASGWLTPDQVAYRAMLSTDMSRTASRFQRGRAPDIKSLVASVAGLVQSLNDHLAHLKTFDGELGGAQKRLQEAIGQLQAKRTGLESQIASFNEEIASLQQEIAQDRSAIAEAMSNRRSNIIKTVFGIVLAPITAGISITIAGLGTVSEAEAVNRIGSLKAKVSDSEQRMIGLRDGLDDNDAMLVSMNLMLVPGGIILGDLASASRALSDVTESWTLFEQEMRHVMGELVSSSAAPLSVVQRGWYDTACWEMIEIASMLSATR